MSDITSTTEQMEAYMAWRRGETVEVMTVNTGGWVSFSPTGTLLPHYILRRKPKLRRWKPEEVPVGAIVRRKDCPSDRVLITAVVDGRIYAGKLAQGDNWQGDWAMEKTEYSVDMGKTWWPVGVLEESP